MRKSGIFILFAGIAAGMAFAMAGTSQASTHNAVMNSKMMASNGHLQMPSFDARRGRKLFASKGCVVCHSINGVGGEDAPALDADTMPMPMNPFDFTARMWRGASTMIEMQVEELGDQIEFTGDELSDIIAFAHDENEQKKFSPDDIPANIANLMKHLGSEDEEHESEEHESDTQQ